MTSESMIGRMLFAIGVIALIPALIIALIYFRVAKPIGGKR